MISVFVQDKKILCSFYGTDAFTSIVATLKQFRCHFDPKKKVWEIPLARYQPVLDALQDLDTVQLSTADEIEIANLDSGLSELRMAPQRMMFHSELLTYPPFKGKHPYEDYQLQDILRALNRNRYGLYLDMGLGKAYIAAAIIAHLRYYKMANKVVLLSSNIGAPNMMHELKKFIVDLDPNEIAFLGKISRVKKIDRDIFQPEKRIVVTSYNTFRHLSDHYYDKLVKSAKKENESNKKRSRYLKPPIPLKEWLGNEPGILLLDESHNLASPQSEQTRCVAMHAPFFEYRYEFTGTPADKPEKLYTQLNLLDPALVRGMSYQDWCAEYNEVGNHWSSWAINPNGWRYDKLQELNNTVTKNYGVFRKSGDVLELPPNIIKKLYTNMDPKHREIYQAFVKSTLDDIKKRTGGFSTRDIINSFPYMQMALDNPTKLLDEHRDLLSPKLVSIIEEFKLERDHTKVDLLLDILEEQVDTNGERGIIWVWHPATAKALAKLLEKYNPLVIVGEIDDNDRMPILEKFKSNSSHKVLIASIQVLNTSVTLIEATFQVYFERVYNFAQYWQSIARIHRIGKRKKTITYVLIFDNSIDVALDINLSNKDLLNSKILSKEFLSLDAWKSIFNATDTGNEILSFDW
jgi:SNF2 family DNA or RNA helicase